MKLAVWQRSVDFVTEVYKEMAGFPSDERYGLVSKVSHASISIPSNLTEGAERGTSELIHFVDMVISSSSELDTQLEISRLGYLPDELRRYLDKELAQINHMFIGLCKSLLEKQMGRYI